MKMKIDVDFIVQIIDEYCLNCADCPKDCFFDTIGVCTEENAFSSIMEKYKELK